MKDNYTSLLKALAFFCLFTVFSFNISAQVGIGTTNPNPNALLDLDATNTPGGLLLPRMALSGTTSFAPMTANVEGMVVYNTATTSAGPNQVTPGYYYNDGSGWVRVATSSASSSDWAISGNASTSPGIGASENYLGTSDGEDLVIGTDGSERVRVLSTGEVGIGASPDNSAALDISSSSKGVSFPNINLLSVSDAATIASPVPGLMVFNTNTALPCGAGLYFNNGTATVPIWSCFTKTTHEYHAYNTASLTVSSVTGAGTFYLQPGLTINFTVPAGQVVDVKMDAVIGALLNYTGNNGIGTFDTAFFLDGVRIALGGYERSTAIKPGGSAGLPGFTSVSLTSVWRNVGAGNHTIQLGTAYSSGIDAVIVGGDCALSAICGEINAVVTYK